MRWLEGQRCVRFREVLRAANPIRIALSIALSLSIIAPLVQASKLKFQSGLLSITINDPRDRNRISTVITTFNQAKQDLLEIGLIVPKIELEATANAAQFSQLSGEPASIAAITIGTKILTQRLGALQTRGLLSNTIRHELFHSAQPKRLPRWLAEGLARHFSGEDKNDPPQATNLESKTEAQLNALLETRTPQGLNRAYLEATKRAVKLVRTKGWKQTLERK
jgi:hypothetical protein